MKTIDFKSMLIGLLAGISIFLLMGAYEMGSHNYNHGVGQYQAYYSDGAGSMMIDTETGVLYDWDGDRNVWIRESNDQNWILE